METVIWQKYPCSENIAQWTLQKQFRAMSMRASRNPVGNKSAEIFSRNDGIAVVHIDCWKHATRQVQDCVPTQYHN